MNELVRDRKIAFAGRLASMSRREATNLLRSFGGIPVDLKNRSVDLVVVGANVSPLSEHELLGEPLLSAAGRGELDIVPEAELWQRLGLVDAEQSVRKYYTPTMLAELLNVSVHVIRRWHRRGLITPVRTMHRLPYFDFQEVRTAKRLADWITEGASAHAIEQRLVDLVEVLPDLQRPLDQLSILVEGRDVLLRRGEGLVEPSGQLRFDFPALDDGSDNASHPDHVVFSIESADPMVDGGNLRQSAIEGDDPLIIAAFEAEDEDDLETAIDYCHAILARDGPRADVNFQLGELLYRIDEPVAARERYYAAIELDDQFVEARSSLAAVLAETGQTELAVAAYQGVLSLHNDYPDAHYYLAKLLSDAGRHDEANVHWQRLLTLAPETRWADEAHERLGR